MVVIKVILLLQASFGQELVALIATLSMLSKFPALNECGPQRTDIEWS